MIRIKTLTILSFGELITVFRTVFLVVVWTDQIGTALQLATDVAAEILQPIDVPTDFYHCSVTLPFVPARKQKLFIQINLHGHILKKTKVVPSD